MPNAVDRGRTEPAGRLTRRATKALLAALHPAGGLRRSRGHALALAGSLLPSGALTKRAQPVLAALVHPAAAIARQGRRTLLRSVAGGAHLHRAAQRALRAALAPGGRLLRTAQAALAAALGLAAAPSRARALNPTCTRDVLARWAPTRARCWAPLT